MKGRNEMIRNINGQEGKEKRVRKINKGVMSILIVLLLSLAISGCTKKDNPEPSAPSPDEDIHVEEGSSSSDEDGEEGDYVTPESEMPQGSVTFKIPDFTEKPAAIPTVDYIMENDYPNTAFSFDIPDGFTMYSEKTSSGGAGRGTNTPDVLLMERDFYGVWDIAPDDFFDKFTSEVHIFPMDDRDKVGDEFSVWDTVSMKISLEFSADRALSSAEEFVDLSSLHSVTYGENEFYTDEDVWVSDDDYDGYEDNDNYDYDVMLDEIVYMIYTPNKDMISFRVDNNEKKRELVEHVLSSLTFE
jgi:hypothetical protein